MDSPQAPAPSFEYLGIKTFWIFVLEKSQGFFGLLLVAIISGVLEGQKGMFNGSYGEIVPQLSHTVYVAALFISLIYLLLIFFISYLQYVTYRFALDVDAIKIHRGILNREEFAIPYRQIQDINIRQNFIEQILGVGRLIILTAGTEDREGGEAEGGLPSIDYVTAVRLQNALLQKTDVQKVTVL